MNFEAAYGMLEISSMHINAKETESIIEGESRAFTFTISMYRDRKIEGERERERENERA